MATQRSAANLRRARAADLRRVLGDGVITHLISEFSEAFAFARTRWTKYAEEVHPQLKGGTMVMLSVILKRGPITATEIGHLLDLDKGFVSRQVAHLKELGFVESSPAPDDGRVILLSANDKAREAFDNIHVNLASAYQERFSDWTDDELEHLVVALRRFNASTHDRPIHDSSPQHTPQHDAGSHGDAERD